MCIRDRCVPIDAGKDTLFVIRLAEMDHDLLVAALRFHDSVRCLETGAVLGGIVREVLGPQGRKGACHATECCLIETKASRKGGWLPELPDRRLGLRWRPRISLHSLGCLLYTSRCV